MNLLTAMLPVILFLMVQTGGLIWFLASVKKDIVHIKDALITINASIKDFITHKEVDEKLKGFGDRYDEKFKRVWDKVEEHEKELDKLSGKVFP